MTSKPASIKRFVRSVCVETVLSEISSSIFLCLTSADFAMNIVVLKTITGAAQAVAFALESVVNEEIVGSIAGDDTIMIVVRSEKNAKNLAYKLKKYIQ